MKSEHLEALDLTNYLRINGYKFHHSPNETYTTSWKQKTKNKTEGVSKGFPDYTIILKRGSLLFIELKKARGPKGGKNGSQISIEQIEWINELSEIKNVEAMICFGAEESIKNIKILENL